MSSKADRALRRSGSQSKNSGGELFGQIAVRKGFVSQRDVDEALARQKELESNGRPHRLIGMIMLEMGLLGTTELIEILRDIRTPGVPAGDGLRPQR